MAIAIASSTISDFTSGTDIGDDTEFTISAPSSIAEGDLLLVYMQGERTAREIGLPSGFTEITIPNREGTSVKLAYKYAVSADESATEYTFTVIADDAAEARYAMYRLTGAQSSGTPVIFSDGFDETADGTSVSEAVSVQSVTGALVLVLISGAESGSDTIGDFSALSVTGPTVSFTERFDSAGNPGAGTAQFGALWDGIPSTDGDISNISFTYNDDTEDNDVMHVSVLVLFPQQDATANLTLTTTTNTAFAPTGQAGATASLTLTETTNEAFAPSGIGYAPTKWTTTPKS